MTTTGNGRPWGENAGRVGSGILYGWIAKRGIEAAQRRQPQPGDHDWTTAQDAAQVSGLWFIYIVLLISHSWLLVNGAVMIIASFLDRSMGGGMTKGVLTLFTAVPAMVFTYWCLSAGRALVARAEHLPPRKGEMYLQRSWFPQKWWKLWLFPYLSFAPFTHVQGALS